MATKIQINDEESIEGIRNPEDIADEIDYLKLQLKEYRSLVRNNPKEKTRAIRDEIDRIRNLIQELPVI